jgi:agmatine deiminase
MKILLVCILALMVVGLFTGCNNAKSVADPDNPIPKSDIENKPGVDDFVSDRDIASTRIPAEWEKQESIWIQWPLDWERSLRPSFVKIISVIQQYEPVNILIINEAMKASVEQLFNYQNIILTNVTFHFTDYDNAWLRDNGPVYVFDKDSKWLQDFGFDGWGQNFGKTYYKKDDKIPLFISNILGTEYENNNAYILERGNLEANGKDVVMLNWDAQSDRNPKWSREETNKLFKKVFGVSTVVWVEGHHPEDGTTGHIDGIARFVNETTVVVAQITDPAIESIPGEMAMLDNAAAAAKDAGLTVERFLVPGYVKYKGTELVVMYMNYLVGNEFVLGMAFGNKAWDDEAKAKLEELYPGRTVHMVEVNELWYAGGGIHCVTNDEPSFE